MGIFFEADMTIKNVGVADAHYFEPFLAQIEKLKLIYEASEQEDDHDKFHSLR